MEAKYKESGCEFTPKYQTMKFDDFIEKLKLNNIFKSVDFIVLKNTKVFFIEVKSFDYFKKEQLDQKLDDLVRKLSDSYFLINAIENNSTVHNFLSSCKSTLNKSIQRREGRLSLVVLVCPPQYAKLTYDRLTMINIILNRLRKKVNSLKVSIYVDDINNSLGLFKSIKISQS